MTPEVFTEYIPTLATVRVAPGAIVQLGAVCEVFGSHKRIVEVVSTDATPATLNAVVSLIRRFFVCAVLRGPLDVSGNAVGFGELWHMAPSSALSGTGNIEVKSVVVVTVAGLLVRYSTRVKVEPDGETITSPNPFDQIASPETVLLNTVTEDAAHK
jgi:hypothetical protein